MATESLKKIHDWLWEIPPDKNRGMRVPARIYTSEKMLREISRDRSLDQLKNVACLPGIQKYALVMPDAHEGYGFPIGGVAAFDVETGVISPGGIGYDINCGVRLLKSPLRAAEIAPRLEELAAAIYQEVPSGVGRGGRLKLSRGGLDVVLTEGAKRMVKLGYGKKEDLQNIESSGVLENAEPELVSAAAHARGADQLGTLGAGNHFVEVGRVEKIYDEPAAAGLGLFENQATALIHTGSRGLGHQVATDYIRTMAQAMAKYNIEIPDRELACAPFNSEEGQDYFRAMAAAANFAWANRQLITDEVRRAFTRIFGSQGGDLEIVYDVAHNIAKIEEYGGKKLVVHRKGATRAFPGQPVLLPGSMGTGSWVLLGQATSLQESFGSTAHGAGRRLSRAQAKREIAGGRLKQELEKRGIVVMTGSLSGLAEEAPQAYKDVDEVAEVVASAGLAKKVARLAPLAVIKG